MKAEYLTLAKEAEAGIIEARRLIHQNPEYGMELPVTKAFVRKRLEALGYAVSDCGQGLTATVGKGGSVILLRADMDALAIREDNDLPYRSTNDYAHLCGHDIHTAVLLGAAEILKKKEGELAGTVKLMFQPGEEIAEGAGAMVGDGILENPKVDAAMALHVDTGRENGTFCYTRGTAFSYMDLFDVEVEGCGGHGSMPEAARNPLHTVVQIYNQLSGIVSQESSMFDSAVLSIGQLGGGNMPNVIPDRARIGGSLRCFDPAVRERIMTRLEKIVKNTADSTGTSYIYRCKSLEGLYNDPVLCEQIGAYLSELLEDDFYEEKIPATASDDFAIISHKVPTMYIMMGVGHEGAPKVHDPKVVFEEDQLYRGSAALAYAAARWLREEHKDDLK